ncbi:hypothetical protein RRG08_031641 [Elysia crispata]|uniref:Uncharacterized protein n=1 Tax=Elysia crispata TaxID=231223 RepID=A0AAE1ACR1_9GAST|nr:hypothetical protein RRG08_031641 [Elysia crispata]
MLSCRRRFEDLVEEFAYPKPVSSAVPTNYHYQTYSNEPPPRVYTSVQPSSNISAISHNDFDLENSTFQ